MSKLVVGVMIVLFLSITASLWADSYLAVKILLFPLNEMLALVSQW
jgi:hypothetical protein